MITDPTALIEFQEVWKGIEALRDRVQRAIVGSFAMGSPFAIFAADSVHNLPFIHACSVLNDVLAQLANEGHFKCKSIFLGSLVQASATTLSWQDLSLIQEGVAQRNGVAHKGQVLPRADCWKYIDAIKSQLTAWAII